MNKKCTERQLFSNTTKWIVDVRTEGGSDVCWLEDFLSPLSILCSAITSRHYTKIGKHI